MKFSDHNFKSIDSERFHMFERLNSKTLQDSKDRNKTSLKMHFGYFCTKNVSANKSEPILTHLLLNQSELSEGIIGRPSPEVQATLSQCPPGRENVKLPKSQRSFVEIAQGRPVLVKRVFLEIARKQTAQTGRNPQDSSINTNYSDYEGYEIIVLNYCKVFI